MSQDGAAIRRLREERKLTVTQLAGRVGIRTQSLSNIELENKPAGVGVLVAIARELGVAVDTVLKTSTTQTLTALPRSA